ncbi:protein GET1 [Arachis duranensis]|uniref:Tail-anchored protein insertion receptor WRB n=2 Tax=Arachis TaxID=3817 RepID=A0A444WUT6_ARAHY|nr:protein GET1 [Arachis duranensis]XP_016200597.1 uncharacterized protein LOC107641627 [Arachis ipaensis]XP_025651586.1 uncharacterized protein LOC112747650 [Arachis hypogaea]XP_025698235.1 uncharacterized protein LOC112800260 [Arachis hypogaea]QHO40287.1 uncharacterized protein DS421_5g136250 [Arachis hypogaea]RYQ81227.1 hypothetical protein Ahy_Scaffold1g107208 [Arachis hypogaea]
MGDEASHEHRDQGSLAAPFVFLVVASVQFSYFCLDYLKKKGSVNDKQNQLRAEIKGLLKEAKLLSQPATFAQAAKLKRLAATKEKELAKFQNMHHRDYALYTKLMLVTKYVTYALLLFWFWHVPVASISMQLVQPFGRLLSWNTSRVQENHATIGIISWLVVSARFCRFVRKAYS